jgi:Protein of unknown function (DUF2950)
MPSERLHPARLLGAAFVALLLLGSPRAAPAEEAQTFASPQDAARALVEAARTDDDAALRRIVGEKDADLVLDSDDPAVAARRKRFAEGADHRLFYREEGPDRVILVVGFRAYPFPIPLVRTEGGWQFDAAEGAEEIVDRTVGRNELTAISVLRDYVDAQQEYASEPRDGSRVRHFATRFLSTPGRHDGLYWKAAEGEEPSPFGPLFEEQGQASREAPYYGYHYRILTAQGASAPGGAYSYVIHGNLVAGFAAIAWPDEYARTGVMTFLVNHYGVVYERDLGPDTAKIAPRIRAYAPDDSWREAE